MLVMTDLYNALLSLAAINHTASGNFDGPLRGATAGLFINNITPNKTSVLTDFTPPTYTGYARIALTWSPPVRDTAGNIGTESNLATFQMPDATHPNIAFGYILVASDGTTLLGAELFGTAISLNDAVDFVSLVMHWLATNVNPGSATVVH